MKVKQNCRYYYLCPFSTGNTRLARLKVWNIFTSQVWHSLELSFWFPPLVACRKTHQCTHLGMETHLHQRRWPIRTCHPIIVCLCCLISSVFMLISNIVLPSEKISQSSTPNDQTSLCVVYTRSKMVSGAIHLRGRRACDDREEMLKHKWVYFAEQKLSVCVVRVLTSPLRT